MNTTLRCSLALVALAAFCPMLALAQAPPRFYWKSLAGANAVPVIYQDISGNSNPLDPAHVVSPEANIDAEVVTVGVAKMLPLFDRTATIALLETMGRMSSTIEAGGKTASESARGYGDPMLEFGINLVGPSAIMGIPDMMRYEPKFSLDLIADVFFPVGEYDSERALNIGQNRWYGRVGAPVVWQLGAWVPGQRTTLETVPSLWLFDDNTDYLGETLSTDPMFQLESHLTRDLAVTHWASLDATWMTGGASTVGDGEEGDATDTLGLGFTLGYQVNDNLAFTFGYMSTVNDSDPGDLQMDGFRVSLTYGWHKVIEGSKRLSEGH
ncbi:MAG: transporter [Lentisphaerae bacterium]|nr:transporter [Lentisphaerota bacterium]